MNQPETNWDRPCSSTQCLPILVYNGGTGRECKQKQASVLFIIPLSKNNNLHNFINNSPQKWWVHHCHHHHHHHHQSLNYKDRWGIPAYFATSFFLHPPSWSPPPSGICQTPGLSIPWCCLVISSFVRLVFFLPFIVRCKIVLVKPDERGISLLF